MPDYPTIAGVVLTLNEEADLPRSLQSLHWCDELLVLDSGSTDQTKETAERYGARFLQRIQPKPFQITDQRNWAMNSCGLSSDWVLFLDADECISMALQDNIKATLFNNINCVGFEMTPRYWFLGRWLKRTQGYPNWHPRLARRGYCWFEGGVWESFPDKLTIGRISTPYEHYAFSKGFDDWVMRHLRYASWEATKIVEFQSTHDINSLGTNRSIILRQVALKSGLLRPFLRFFQKYVLQLGFLEGKESFLFCLMMSFYDLMTLVKVAELQRRHKGQQL